MAVCVGNGIPDSKGWEAPSDLGRSGRYHEYIASEKEDLESYKADLEEALEELKDMRADWKPEKEPNMDEEIELIKKWVKEREDFINE